MESIPEVRICDECEKCQHLWIERSSMCIFCDAVAGLICETCGLCKRCGGCSHPVLPLTQVVDILPDNPCKGCKNKCSECKKYTQFGNCRRCKKWMTKNKICKQRFLCKRKCNDFIEGVCVYCSHHFYCKACKSYGYNEECDNCDRSEYHTPSQLNKF